MGMIDNRVRDMAICAAFVTDEKVSAIAARHSVTGNRIYAIAYNNGCHRPKNIHAARDLKICAARLSGMTYVEIAEMIGVTKSTVASVIHRASLGRRTQEENEASPWRPRRVVSVFLETMEEALARSGRSFAERVPT